MGGVERNLTFGIGIFITFASVFEFGYKGKYQLAIIVSITSIQKYLIIKASQKAF